MKKLIIVIGLILVLVVGSAIAYAESNTQLPFGMHFNRRNIGNTQLSEEQIKELAKDRDKFFEENKEYRKEELKKALDNGEITQKQYDAYLDHFNYMEDFHKENGYLGNCHGGRGMMRGMGRGHMNLGRVY